ncbi:uncharacterized protein LOC132203360 [Neocloeon triangulifer]|uniref:uncharacterized protein LOC132203360 n=1 Tax=Neocloeon triangulifer TaxID=2078957 RepID=UPI00286EB80E|nr:uncharacterized protein LOC132203360 [Neocloeon triangulifer]
MQFNFSLHVSTAAERHARKLWKRGHKRRIQRVLGKKFEQPPAGGKLRTTGLPNYVTDAVVSKDIQHLNLSDKYALAVINGFVPSAGQGRNVVTDYLRPFLTPQMDLVHDDGEVNEMDDDDEFTRAGSRQQALAAGHRHAHFELGRVQN